MFRRVHLALLFLAMVAACEADNDVSPPGLDTGGGVDAAVPDAESDGGSVPDATDAASEAGVDAAVDAPVEAASDASTDSGVDAAVAKTWSTPVRVSPAVDGDVLSHQVAFGPSGGTAVAVWLAAPAGSGVYSVWASVYTIGAGWSTATRIDSVNFFADRPQVAMDASGNAFVVWEQSDGASTIDGVGARHNIWSNRYAAGVGWSGATLLETLDGDFNFPRSADSPRIAASATGAAHAVWTQGDAAGGASLWQARYSPGAGWGSPTLVENTSFAPGPPSVAMDGSGNSTVVWVQSDGTNFHVYGRYNDGSVLALDTNVGGNPYPPEIAMAGAEAVVTWSDNCSKWGNRLTGGAWGTALRLQNNASCAAASSPQVLMEANGSAMAYWLLNTGAALNYHSNISNPGTGWAGTTPLKSGIGNFTLATNPAGQRLGTWTQSTTLYANTVYNDVNQGAVIDATEAYTPRIAMSGAGTSVLIYVKTETSGVRNTIWASRYE